MSIPGRLPAALPLSLQKGRSPDSRVLTYRLPGQFAQWLFDTSSLAYRCGGSTGMVSMKRTCFPIIRCPPSRHAERSAMRHLSQILFR